MNRRTLLVFLSIAGLLLGGWGIWRLVGQRPTESVQSNLLGALSSAADGAFTRADGPRELRFPADQGPHPDFQTEWWYYTGNLTAQDGREYGFQLTFFRRALSAPAEQVQRLSNWGTNQIYLAHFALTDVSGKQFYYQERFERGAAGLAGAQVDPAYRVWLQDWQVNQTGATSFQLTAAQNGAALSLTLQDEKGPVLQGDRGYSQKGPDAGSASYYVSQTRLKAAGTVTLDGVKIPVSGLSWMDHEWSTSALSVGQVGWDWFSIQLDDGSELMAYTLRQADGSVDPYSRGTLIAADGSTRALQAADFTLKVEDSWKSPHSGGVYPAGWVLQIPSAGLTLRIHPALADQELNTSIIYWEGSVRVSGERNGKPVSGKGYTELTGYAQSLAGKF